MFAIPANKTVRSTFTHYLLPTLVLMNPKKFHADISGGSAAEYLRQLWLGLGKQMGLRTFDHHFFVSKLSLGQNEELYLIHLPQPVDLTDAFYSAAYFRLKKGLFSLTIEEQRYFTLELSTGGEWKFCEWQGYHNSSRHLNYGDLPDIQAATFISAIQAKTTPQ